MERSSPTWVEVTEKGEQNGRAAWGKAMPSTGGIPGRNIHIHLFPCWVSYAAPRSQWSTRPTCPSQPGKKLWAQGSTWGGVNRGVNAALIHKVPFVSSSSWRYFHKGLRSFKFKTKILKPWDFQVVLWNSLHRPSKCWSVKWKHSSWCPGPRGQVPTGQPLALE